MREAVAPRPKLKDMWPCRLNPQSTYALPDRPYSLVLEELKEENSWKNDLVLFWLSDSIRCLLLASVPKAFSFSERVISMS